ncbi:MAG: poly-gamma-glutamate hydrolase family protein [Xanthobacteraceae bacterium]
MTADRYQNFADLISHEREGIDFRICRTIRPAPVAIIAPHGGGIEPGTSDIAAAIAGDCYSLYCFEGLKRSGNRDLHIMSTNFDEPTCLDLLSRCDVVVAVHGLRGENRFVDVGGSDFELRNTIRGRLSARFDARVAETGRYAGSDPANICNRGRGGAGVQLEITRALRDTLIDSLDDMEAFADAVRQSIDDALAS